MEQWQRRMAFEVDDKHFYLGYLGCVVFRVGLQIMFALLLAGNMQPEFWREGQQAGWMSQGHRWQLKPGKK